MNLPNLNFPSTLTLLFILLAIWETFWKGVGLWHAVRNNQKNWFIAMLVLNTAGILQIVYLKFFQKKQK